MTTTEQAAVKTTGLPNPIADTMPFLPTSVKDAKATREWMFTLRHFHLGDPSAGTQLDRVGDDWLPALLNPYRDATRLRYHYPLLMLPINPDNDEQLPDDLALPIGEWMRTTLERLAPGADGARILKDNLPWIERYLRHGRGEQDAPEDAVNLLAEAGRALQKHLSLDDVNRERLGTDLEKLQTELPEHSQILTYGRYAALHLMFHAVDSRVTPRRRRFQQQIELCIRGLRALLKIEHDQSAAALAPDATRQTVGLGGDLFDTSVLSTVIDHTRGTRVMPEQRRERIEKVLAILQAWQPDPVLIRLVYYKRPRGSWLDQPGLATVMDAEPCVRATQEFDEKAGQLAEIFSAVRIAQLEVDGRYDPTFHDPWFESFNWEAFSHEELLMVPTVVALETPYRIANTGLPGFSKLLSSGRPVQIMVRVQPHNNPISPDKPFATYRTELGYIGLSHRQAVVTQTSTARHHHLLKCFLGALDATRTGLHLINVGMRPPGKLLPLNAWLVAGAGIESRAHPFFRINPEAGDSAASRMDFSDNPEPEAIWPSHAFAYLDDNGNEITTQLAFTFADYSLLIERLRDHFRVIPPACDSDSLIPIQSYLEMSEDEAYRYVPFVWAVDGGAKLHRIVISRELTLACRDRINFWRSMQELAGVRNRYVEHAIIETQQTERAAAAAAREQLLAEHAAEVAHVRSTAAGEAMQRLADTLLGLDLSGPTNLGMMRPAAAKATTPSVQAEPEQEIKASAEPANDQEAATETYDEAWLDTPLCTSCNDCTKINPQMFIYNDEKQAMLGDVSAGSYADLVRAAELCPANCIHPGPPLNPNEAGLDDLIARAAPYNQV